MLKKLTTGLIASACLLSAALPIKSNASATTRMLTSYYAHYFHGRTTANGERFDMWISKFFFVIRSCKVYFEPMMFIT